jgi:hypothetical protein
MLFVFIGLLGIGVTVFSIILILSYAIYEYQSEKIGHKNTPTQSHAPSNFTLQTLTSSKPALVAHDLYERTMIHIKESTYPDWINTIIEFVDNVRRNGWASIKNLFTYLLSLTRPAHASTEVDTAATTELERDEMHKTVQNVNEIDTFVTQQNSTQSLTTDSATDYDDSISAIQSASSTSANELFEKLESRILDKLKKSSMKNYDMWLELGELYLKYDQKEKAGEVFALVLKHAHEERQIDMARNYLIGL